MWALVITVFIFIIINFVIVYKDAKNSPYLAIFFSSFERLSFFLGFTVTPIFLFSLTSMFVFFIKGGFKDLLNEKKIIFFIFLPFLGAISSMIFSGEKTIALKSSVYVFLYCVFLFVLYIIIRKFKITEFINLYFSTLITFFFFSLYAIIQFVRYYFNLTPDIIKFNIPGNNTLDPIVFVTHVTNSFIVLRPNSWFSDINTTAGFTGLYLPLILCVSYVLFREFRARNEKKILYLFLISFIVSILSLLGLILMNSRSIYIGIVCTFIIFVLFYVFKKYSKYKYLLLFFSIFLVLFIAVSESGKINKYLESDYSSTVHIDALNSDMRMFMKYPLFGGGIGTFPIFFNNEIKEGKIQAYTTVTNPPLYLKYLAEEGIFGFTCNIIFFVFIVKKSLEGLVSQATQYKYISLSLLFGLMSILIANIFHSYFQLYFSGVFIAIILGFTQKSFKEKSLN